jgi:hypothetical protein
MRVRVATTVLSDTRATLAIAGSMGLMVTLANRALPALTALLVCPVRREILARKVAMAPTARTAWTARMVMTACLASLACPAIADPTVKPALLETRAPPDYLAIPGRMEGRASLARMASTESKGRKARQDPRVSQARTASTGTAVQKAIWAILVATVMTALLASPVPTGNTDHQDFPVTQAPLAPRGLKATTAKTVPSATPGHLACREPTATTALRARSALRASQAMQALQARKVRLAAWAHQVNRD